MADQLALVARDAIRLACMIEWEDDLYGGDWDDLFERGLLREGSDQTGERWPVLTTKGRERLREVAYIISGVLDPGDEDAITEILKAKRKAELRA